MYVPPCGPDEELIGILISIPEPWMSELSDMRASVGDKHADVTPAHITLLPPTAVKKADREAVMEHLQAVANTHAPFHVSLRGAGTFRPVSPVVFVNVERGAEQLVQLEHAIRSGILDIKSRFPFHPHVTIAQIDSEECLDRAQELGSTFEAEWVVPGFRVDRVDEDGMYHSRAIFNFNAVS